ncbi:Spx/MgsR family RNA polymerase-binding regulatory protein [Pedobacter montanisoli]|uniref:Spx/MgsR family RNA polymerase-binding regulatory protein n=1 Tax=Pedobacter montanisoli TaxID=2923277 RepID=A0ABS9ZVA1_9SPHI|nr:Spx/MgsR family RNA polymerase-binding regulatory protein [Pedobacter montanisoli]MCJ0742239.1 Spx/MgsR family RNA polymerase-binding regulatory protein [Pedobacter montanisoli]
MILYGIPNCNTVKKAQDWLKEKNIAFEFHDFKKKGITNEKLKIWFKTFGAETVLNKKGLTYKKLSKEEQSALNNENAIIAYLKQNTSAIKRPVVEINNEPVLIGFDENTYTAKLAK